MTTTIAESRQPPETLQPPPEAAAPQATGDRPAATVLRFPYGLPGFPEATAFRLEALEGCDGRFALLHATDDPELRLVVMLAPDGHPVVAERHVREACTALGWAREAVALLFVVTLAAAPDGLDAFVNLRAPIFVDTERALAVQVVLSDPGYPFRQPLGKRQPA